MKHYSASLFRQQVSRALDEAERGEMVIVERRGLRFRLVQEPTAAEATPRPWLEVLDRRLLDSDWYWDWKPGQLKLRFRRPRTRR